jgi:predicted O-methyltransferase YrrM
MTAWWKDSTPETVKPIPWIGVEAKRVFGYYLKPETCVLEFGAGGSTLWMQDKVKQIISIENDKAWHKALKKKINKDVVTLVLWDKPEPPEYKQLFDLVFIDGEPIERRGNWIKALSRLVKPNGIVVLDNANREEFSVEHQWLTRKANLLNRLKGRGGIYTVTEFYEWLG